MIAIWTEASLTMLGFAIIMFLKIIDNSLNISEENLDGCVDPFQKTRRSSFLFSICDPYFSILLFFYIIFFLNVAGSSSRSLQAELPP